VLGKCSIVLLETMDEEALRVIFVVVGLFAYNSNHKNSLLMFVLLNLHAKLALPKLLFYLFLDLAHPYQT